MTINWVCEACGHHNSKINLKCRRCRTPRGGFLHLLRGRRRAA